MTHHFVHQLHQVSNVLLKRGYLLGGWVLIITWLSLKPIEIARIAVVGLDKIAHFFFYLVMAFLANHQQVFLEKSNRKEWFVFLYCALFGLGIEIIQGTLIEGRYFELWDLIANIIGIIVGIIVSNFFFK
jgi:glycopeptide antibiotics resistance protein